MLRPLLVALSFIFTPQLFAANVLTLQTTCHCESRISHCEFSLGNDAMLFTARMSGERPSASACQSAVSGTLNFDGARFEAFFDPADSHEIEMHFGTIGQASDRCRKTGLFWSCQISFAMQLATSGRGPDSSTHVQEISGLMEDSVIADPYLAQEYVLVTDNLFAGWAYKFGTLRFQRH